MTRKRGVDNIQAYPTKPEYHQEPPRGQTHAQASR